MRRKIVQPADVSGAALAELKAWLSITRDAEDGMLIDLLQASLALCEAFTGQMPVEQIIEERSALRSGTIPLSARPIRSLVSVEEVSAQGQTSPLTTDQFQLNVTVDGAGSVRITAPATTATFDIRAVAGMAANWETMPTALKQGVVRMAGHMYRNRDSDASNSAPPPASVTALWRPWRMTRLT